MGRRPCRAAASAPAPSGNRKFTALISVENKEYPTQMYAIDEKGNQEFFIWIRKE